jgi:PilZ domain
MLTSPASLPEIETAIRVIVAPLGQPESYAGADCQIDLGRDGATVTVNFPERRAPQLSIGEAVVLHFDLRDEIGALATSAKISAWRVGAGEQSYQFQVETQEAAALAELIGQRTERRVRINFDNPVRARLSGRSTGLAREGALFDLSPSGCAILFDAEETWMLECEQPLEAQLDLFPGEQPVRARAHLRSRRLCGLQVVHGYRLELLGMAAQEDRSRLDRFLALRAHGPAK